MAVVLLRKEGIKWSILNKELRQEMVDVCLESLHEGMFTERSGNLSVALGTALCSSPHVGALYGDAAGGYCAVRSGRQYH